MSTVQPNNVFKNVAFLLRERQFGTTFIKARTERRNWTELKWYGLVFDELTNGQTGRAYWSLVTRTCA